MVDLTDFVARASAFARLKGRTLKGVSKQLFRDTDTLTRLSEGWRGVQISTLERAQRRLDRLERGLRPDADEGERAGERAA